MKKYLTPAGFIVTRLLGGRSNVFLVEAAGILCMIDTGPERVRKKLMLNLNQLGITKIDYLILTHTHFDHAGNAGFIRKGFGCKVIVHAVEAAMLTAGHTPLPKGTNIVTRLLIGLANSGIIAEINITPCKPVICFTDNQNNTDLIPGIRIMSTPGHTLGSISLVIDNQIVICGDTLFGIIPGSVFPPFADDVKALRYSWKLLLNTGAKIFLPSHGRPVSRKLLGDKVSGYR